MNKNECSLCSHEALASEKEVHIKKEFSSFYFLSSLSLKEKTRIHIVVKKKMNLCCQKCYKGRKQVEIKGIVSISHQNWVKWGEAKTIITET